MKTTFTVFLFLCISLSGIAAGIAGIWTANMKGPDGSDMQISFVFKLDGEKLIGYIETPNGDMSISNTKVDGKEFSFEVSFNDMTIKHNCILKEDDTISMKVVGSPMGDSEIILKRKK